MKDVLKLDDDQMDAILAAMGITVLQLLDPQIYSNLFLPQKVPETSLIC